MAWGKEAVFFYERASRYEEEVRETGCSPAEWREETARAVDETPYDPGYGGHEATWSEAGRASEVSEMPERLRQAVDGVNPRFDASAASPYSVNCGSCAFAVDARLQGLQAAVACEGNYPTNEIMSFVTGRECEDYLTLDDIRARLEDLGDGSRAIVGFDRPGSMPGHWLNAVNESGRVYLLDGQVGQVVDWKDAGKYESEQMAVNWCGLFAPGKRKE